MNFVSVSDFEIRASGFRRLFVFVAAVATLCCPTQAAQNNPVDPIQTKTVASQPEAPSLPDLQADFREQLKDSLRQFQQQTLDNQRQLRLQRERESTRILYSALGIIGGTGLLAILLVSLTQTRSLNRLARQVKEQLNQQTDARMDEFAQLKQEFKSRMTELTQFENQAGTLSQDNKQLQHQLSRLQHSNVDLTADNQKQVARLAALENDLTEKNAYIRQVEQTNRELANTNETLTAQLNRQKGAREATLEVLTQWLQTVPPIASHARTGIQHSHDIPETKRTHFESIHTRLRELEQKINSLSSIEERDTDAVER